MKEWEVYIAEAKNGKLYTGITNDFDKRMKAHRSGKGGARFFRLSSLSAVVFRERQPDKSSALKRELAIKKMTRQEKLDLIGECSNG